MLWRCFGCPRPFHRKGFFRESLYGFLLYLLQFLYVFADFICDIVKQVGIQFSIVNHWHHLYINILNILGIVNPLGMIKCF